MEKINNRKAKTKKKSILITRYWELLLRLKNKKDLLILTNPFWTLIVDSGEEKMIHSYLKERTWQINGKPRKEQL